MRKKNFFSGESLVGLISCYVELRRQGREYIGLCPFHNERTPSFTVVPCKGFFHCFGCGAHGDAIAFERLYNGLNYRQALRKISFLPIDSNLSRHNKAENASPLRRALCLYENAKPIAGTLAERYLHNRGILLSSLPSGLQGLRFAPSLPYWQARQGRSIRIGAFPALLAAFRSLDGEFRALHTTWLDTETRDKLALTSAEGEPLPAKKIRGRIERACIPLYPPAERMLVAEGIETALSVSMATGIPCLVAGSLTHLAGRGIGQGHRRKNGSILPSTLPDMAHPGFLPPKECRHLIILADSDAKDLEAAEALLRRAVIRLTRMVERVQVLRAPAGKDFNDMLCKTEAGSGMPTQPALLEEASA